MADFLSDTDLSYAAGIIDGEGTIGITEIKVDYEKSNRSRRRKSPQFRGYISVSMTDDRIPIWLSQIFGGTYHSYPPRKPGQKGSTHWRVSGQKCVPICRKLLPFLKLKNEQAITVIDFYNDGRFNFEGTGANSILSSEEIIFRREYKFKIQTLNKRGSD